MTKSYEPDTGRAFLRFHTYEMAPWDVPSPKLCKAGKQPGETFTHVRLYGELTERRSNMVYVLSKEGKPLVPTERHAYVRILLKSGKARVVNRLPFTIQLNYETTGHTQPVILGIDPGRTNIGITAVNERADSLFAAKVQTRNKEIPKLMKARKAFRRKHRQMRRRKKRQRRAKANGTMVTGGMIERHLPSYGEEKTVTCKVIRNKQARFSNRRRPDGWLTPTARQLLETHLNLVKKISKFLPVSQVNIELNQFAFIRLDDPSVMGKDFQNGPLKGFDNDVKGAVYDLQEGKCLLCGKPIEAYHHVVERHKNGSETVRNRVGLCGDCHKLVHTDLTVEKQLKELNRGLGKQYDALGVLSQIFPYLIKELENLYPVHITSGQETCRFRKTYGVPKDHHLDAYVIACSGLDLDIANLPETCYSVRQFRRHDRQVCKREMSNRNYVKDGKVVARNRHKAFAQGTDSLKEYVSKGGRTDQLQVKHSRKAMKDMERFLPGCQKVVKGKVKTLLKRASGSYWFDDGSRNTCKKTKIDLNNVGLAFVSNIVK